MRRRRIRIGWSNEKIIELNGRRTRRIERSNEMLIELSERITDIDGVEFFRMQFPMAGVMKWKGREETE